MPTFTAPRAGGHPFVVGGVAQVVGNHGRLLEDASRLNQRHEAGLAYFRSVVGCSAVTCTVPGDSTCTLPPCGPDGVERPAGNAQRRLHGLRVADRGQCQRAGQRAARRPPRRRRCRRSRSTQRSVPWCRPSRRSASPRRRRRAALRRCPGRRPRRSARSRRRGGSAGPGPAPRSEPARMPSSSARRAAVVQRRLPALRAGFQLPLGVLQVGDLGVQPILARIQVGQDPDQVLRPVVVKRGRWSCSAPGRSARTRAARRVRR